MVHARLLPRQRKSQDTAHVLVVENSKALAHVVQSRCANLPGVQVEVAHDFAYAQELLKYDADRFSAAVVGLVLPDAPDGQIVDLLHERDIRSIVLTGSYDAAQRDSMLARGAADYVPKSGQAGLDYVMRMVERLTDQTHRKILVVDDSSTFRLYMQTKLSQHGYTTVLAENGKEGLEMMKADEDISLVVTDYNMPGMDGLEMTSRLRQKYGHDTLAIIAASDSQDPDLLVKFLKTGATDYLRKSASVEEIFCRIDQNIDMIRNLDRAREAAYIDALTSLPNRRCFFETATSWHAQAMKGEAELLLAIVDLDRFKSINDAVGHKGGDVALQAVADTLSTFVSESQEALAARLGGEEFVCLWKVDAFTDDYDVLESLRSSIADIDCDADGATLEITASIGATRWLADSVDDMVNFADTCLYQAKENGRDCVVQRDTPDIPVSTIS